MEGKGRPFGTSREYKRMAVGINGSRWVQGTGSERSNKPWWLEMGCKGEERGSDDTGFLAQAMRGLWHHSLRQRLQDTVASEFNGHTELKAPEETPNRVIGMVSGSAVQKHRKEH